MRAALTSPTDRRYSKPLLIFPYRAGPKVGKHSWRLQWKPCIGATEDPIAWLEKSRVSAWRSHC